MELNFDSSSGVEFDSDNNKEKYASASSQFFPELSGLTGFLVNNGIVKTEKTANIVLMTIVSLFFISSLIVIINIRNSRIAEPTPEQLNEIMIKSNATYQFKKK